MLSAALAFASLLVAARAQQVGTLTAENHPALTVSKCTASGCTTSSQSIVLDSNWRWLHSTSGSTNCYNGNKWDATLCPSNTACAANCALEGADYASVYGIVASGNSLKLGFVTKGSGTNVGSRTYLMAAGSTTQYQMFNLLNAEFTFDVDVSKLPCGLNGALYFSEMDADGGMSKYTTNKAGAKYGTGYCDAQCPRDLKFINGKANVEGWNSATNSADSGTGARGACCNEMDIWEANSISNAYTPHPCDGVGIDECSGTTCGVGDRYASKCDADGCDINPYRIGNTDFYGPGKTIDTTRVFTVVTQFITDTGTASGTLVDIKRFYAQGGKVYSSPSSKIAGLPGNSITDDFCAAQKTVFGDRNVYQEKGGLAVMGKAISRSVLVMSIWDDYTAQMLWLDAPYPPTADPSAPGVSRGTCAPDSGNPKVVEAETPGAYVTYSNIKWGTLNSTFDTSNIINPDGGSNPTTSAVIRTTTTARGTTSTTSAGRTTTTGRTTTLIRTTTTTIRTTTTTTAARTTTTTQGNNNGGQAQHWGQCAGIGYTGPTACVSPYTCKYSNDWYSQCL